MCTRPGRCEHACVSLEAAGNGVRAAGGISPQLAGFLLHPAAAAGQHSSKCKRIDVSLAGRNCIGDSGTLFEVATSWFTPWFLFVSPMCGKNVSVCTGRSSAVNLQCFADAQLVMLQAQQARCRLRTLAELQF